MKINQEEQNDKFEIKFEIKKELEHNQLLR